MKKNIFILEFMVFFFLINITILAKEKVTILADENYPPYSFMDEKRLTGIYVDIIMEISKNTKNYEIVLEPIPWLRGLKMLEEGEAYAIIPPYYRPKERPYMSYSVPIEEEELVVSGLYKTSKVWPKDYKGKKIGVNRGFLTFDEEERKFINVEEANSTEDNIQKLLAGRIDYYANDKYSILWAIEKLKKSKNIVPANLEKIQMQVSLSKEWAYIGYSKAYNFPKRLEFEGLVNIEIEKMKKNGKIDEIIKNYIGK